MRESRKNRRRFLVVAVAAACIGPAAPGRADRAVPELAPGDVARESDPLPLRLSADAEATTHRIMIPAAVLAKLAGVPPRAMPGTAAATTRSVVAGIAVSLAVGCGFIALRRGRPTRIAAAVLIGVSLAGGGGVCLLSTAQADALPDPVPIPRRLGPEVIDVATLRQGAKVIVELTREEDDELVFVVGGRAEPR